MATSPAHITQEVVEVAASTASSSRVTQTIAEAIISRRDPLARTSQAVAEILISRRVPLPPPVPADLVRIYGADGKRKRFPNRLIESLDWELIEQGYFGTANIRLKDEFDAGDADVSGGDLVEIWLDSQLRYRGYVGIPEQQLTIPERKSITAYGRAERLNSIIIGKRYVFPGGADISQAFARVATEFIATRIPNLEFDIQSVGFDVENLSLERITAREAMNTLVEQAARRAVWGFDVNPATGNDRIFLRPKSNTVKYKHQIGGRVSQYSYPPDYSQIVNKVFLTGAEAKYPNLILNASFEQPKEPDINDGNLVQNPSFEQNAVWVSNFGMLRQTNPYTGSWFMHMDGMDNGGLAWTQQSDIEITAGRTYKCEFMQYGKVGENTLYAELSFYNEGGDLLNTKRYPSFGYITSMGTYQSCGFSAIAPANAVKCQIKFTNAVIATTELAGIDDVAIYDASNVAQEGWKIEQGGGDVTLDWAYDLDSKHGYYCVYIKADLGTNEYVRILQTKAARISVKAKQQYQYSAWVKNLAASDVAVKMGIYDTKWNEKSKTLAPGWNFITWDAAGYTPADDVDGVQVGFKLEVDAEILVDATYFGYYHDLGDGSAYIAGTNYEFVISTDDTFVQTDTELPDEVKGSIANYGLREALEAVDGISDSIQAQNWAKGYFGIKAQPVVAHRVDLTNWNKEIKPDGLFKLLGSTIAPAFPVRVRYKLGGDNLLNVSLDLNTERPTFEGLLQRVLRAAKNAVKSSASSASSALSGGSGSGTSSGHNQIHELASSTGLGSDHTASGLTAGQVLQATAADAARFKQLAMGDGSDGSLAGGLDAIYQNYTTNATPDTEDTIAHGLGRTPVGFVVVSIDKAGMVYKGVTAWDGTNLYLKCSITSASVTILIF
ncbi:MAG: hypothetical protein ABFD54_08895 [Armatimonadota bacterium]|nr:hypothetical protein [bacterium]